MALVLILFPLAMAGLALSIPSNRWRPLVLPATAIVHSACTMAVLFRPEWGSGSPWLVLDPVGALILLPVSTLFLFSSIYAVGYLGFRQERSNRIFTACLSAFLGLISLAIWSHHLGLMWVAIEGMTLVTAPLSTSTIRRAASKPPGNTSSSDRWG